MNSLEALIAILALTTSMVLIIGTINLQTENFQNAKDIILAKTDSLICASIMDSIVSNSAEKYITQINCTAIQNTVSSKINSTTKSSFIISSAESDSTLSVIKYEHYK